MAVNNLPFKRVQRFMCDFKDDIVNLPNVNVQLGSSAIVSENNEVYIYIGEWVKAVTDSDGYRSQNKHPCL